MFGKKMPKRKYSEIDDVMNEDENVVREFIPRNLFADNTVSSLFNLIDQTNSDIIINWLDNDYNKDALVNANIEEFERLSYFLRYNIDDLVDNIKRYTKTSKNFQRFMVFFHDWGLISDDIYRRYINPFDQSHYNNGPVTGVVSDPSYIRSSERINHLFDHLNNNSFNIIMNNALSSRNNIAYLIANNNLNYIISLFTYLTNINSINRVINLLKFYLYGNIFPIFLKSLVNRRIITNNDYDRYLSETTYNEI